MAVWGMACWAGLVLCLRLCAECVVKDAWDSLLGLGLIACISRSAVSFEEAPVKPYRVRGSAGESVPVGVKKAVVEGNCVLRRAEVGVCAWIGLLVQVWRVACVCVA